MITVMEALKLLGGADRLDSRNGKLKSVKGFQLRTILLLIMIMNEEGENQAYYREVYDWSFSSVSAHTKVLLEYGFIVQADDERDPRFQSKRLYLAEGVREYVQEELGIKA